MKKRKVFLTHPVLLIGGRALCLLPLGITTAVVASAIHELISTGAVAECGWAIIVVLMLTGTSIFFCHWLWPQCFSRLILTDNAVIWHCLFMRPRKIEKGECRYAGIREAMQERGKGKWVSTGTKWAWFSTQPFPEGKNISQLRNQNDFIKFPLSVHLSGALGEWLPQPKNLLFAQFHENAQREEKRKMERRRRKREKRRRKRSGNLW